MQRILTSLVLLPLLWVVIKKAPPLAFFVVAAAGIGFACWECYALLRSRGSKPFVLLGVAASVATAATFLGSGVGPAVPIAGAVIASPLAAMRMRKDPVQMLDSVLATLFPVVFIGLMLSYTIGIRALPGADGQNLLFLLMLCIIVADTAAYYVGSAFGRRRLASVISPKKTWEGAVAGVAGSLGAAFLARAWFFPALTPLHAAGLGLLLGVAGILGDLAVSMVKRAAGVKDSSGILPGHGGLLDRTDSLLFTAPILYYWWELFREVLQ
jgi:phosphatidate cytidylyltransferase